MNVATDDRNEITAAWRVLHAALGLSGPVRDEAHARRLAEFAETLAGTLPDDANEPLWGLVSLISERIAAFENRAYLGTNLPPYAVLRELMTEWGLKQQDLPEVGTQSVVSEILSGKRALNLRQIKALSKRFGVSPDIFMG